eukprot:scaffold118397_cov36-Phaeocystis_antarctica.AAC.1
MPPSGVPPRDALPSDAPGGGGTRASLEGAAAALCAAPGAADLPARLLAAMQVVVVVVPRDRVACESCSARYPTYSTLLYSTLLYSTAGAARCRGAAGEG